MGDGWWVMGLVAVKDVACIYFRFHIIQDGCIAVGDDGIRLCLEGSKVVDDAGAEKRDTVFQCRFVDNHLGTLGLDPFHDTLDGTLTEVVTIGLHCQTEDAHNRH